MKIIGFSCPKKDRLPFRSYCYSLGKFGRFWSSEGDLKPVIAFCEPNFFKCCDITKLLLLVLLPISWEKGVQDSRVPRESQRDLRQAVYFLMIFEIFWGSFSPVPF